jgi:Family of unknown function (DUF6644)
MAAPGADPGYRFFAMASVIAYSNDEPPMHSFFVWLETSAFSVWVRESTSVFAFPTILALHTIGMGLVAGLNAAMDLRILGVAPQVPLSELKRFLPFIWIGFWLNAASGVVLLIGYPTKALTNPVFYTKLAFIALGLIVLRAISRRVFREPTPDNSPLPGRVRALATTSLVCWAGAIGTGRFLAYTYLHLMSA